uniref:Mirror-image polydactyly 1 n=1 Tax=Oncorhynchus tshawytscha TaxID=74940 RepID=A0AAZ3RI50_ONCTS
MYKANPKVNEELKQRLPSPVRHQRSETTLPQLGSADLGAILGTTSNQLVLEEPDKDWPQVPQYFRPIEEESRTSRSPSPQAHHRRSPSPQAHHRAPDTGRRMEEERTSSRSPFTQDGYRSEGHSQGSNGSPPVYRRHLVPPDSSQALQSSIKEDQGNIKVSSSSFDSKKQSLVLDKEKNIAFLLKELDSLRELNKKLQDKLAMREKELESRLVDAELMQTQLDARACEKAGALVEEIYQAQRDRDQAVMARLRLANEERDEALLRAKRLQQAVADLENINPEESDADLEELLNRVNSADSALGIERSGGDRGPAAEGPGEKEEDYSRGDECCYRGERDSTGQGIMRRTYVMLGTCNAVCSVLHVFRRSDVFGCRTVAPGVAFLACLGRIERELLFQTAEEEDEGREQRAGLLGCARLLLFAGALWGFLGSWMSKHCDLSG